MSTSNFPLIVTPEGENPFRTTLRAFCRDNEDTPDLCVLARKLTPGESFWEGGGAAPLFTVRRPGARRTNKRWIQDALKYHKKGALHRQLGVPLGEKIPVARLRAAAKGGLTKKARRARLALTLRKINSKRRKKV